MRILQNHDDAVKLAKDPAFQDWVLGKFTGHKFGEFATERMRLFHLKHSNEPHHSDKFPSLNVSRYTNPYRILDRGSQVVVKRMANADMTWLEKMFHLYLYRLFNLETSYDLFLTNGVDLFMNEMADGVTLDDVLRTPVYCGQLTDALVALHKAYDDAGVVLYSRAYKRHTGKGFSDYLTYIPELCKSYFPHFEKYRDLQSIFKDMHKFHGFGDFLAYQFALDVNYCREPMLPIDFVVPGPGALKGIQYSVGSKTPVERIALIKVITEFQGRLFPDFECAVAAIKPEYGGTVFRKIPLEENDVQNLFCEFSKLENLEVFGTKVGRKYTTAEKKPHSIAWPKGLEARYV